MSAIRLGTLRLPAAFVLGLLFSQAFSPGILWGLLGAAALFAQLQLIVAAPRCREAALIAFCFGLGWFGAGLSWTMESMHAHGGLPTWAAAVGLALLATVCSAFGAAAAAAARRAVRRPLFAPFAYASALILAEYLRAGGGLDFGWLNPGAAAVDLPWAGWAPVAGSIGVAVAYLFSLAAVSSAFYAWREGRRLGSVVLLSAAVMSAGGGQLGRFCAWSTSGPTVAMRILQTNQPVVDAFTQTSAADRIEEAARILEGDSAEKDRTDLAITPEGILPGDLASAARSAPHALEHFLKSARGPVLFSGFWREDDGRWFNSAFYADGRSFGRVDKRKLVPFGEFVPKGFRWFVDLMGIPLSDLSEGRMDQALFRCESRMVFAEDPWAIPAACKNAGDGVRPTRSERFCDGTFCSDRRERKGSGFPARRRVGRAACGRRHRPRRAYAVREIRRPSRFDAGVPARTRRLCRGSKSARASIYNVKLIDSRGPSAFGKPS